MENSKILGWLRPREKGHQEEKGGAAKAPASSVQSASSARALVSSLASRPEKRRPKNARRDGGTALLAENPDGLLHGLAVAAPERLSAVVLLHDEAVLRQVDFPRAKLAEQRISRIQVAAESVLLLGEAGDLLPAHEALVGLELPVRRGLRLQLPVGRLGGFLILALHLLLVDEVL